MFRFTNSRAISAIFAGNSCGGFQGAPDVDTPLLPTDIERLPNGQYLVNTLGGTIKLLNNDGSLRGNFMTPAETGANYVDAVRFGSTSLELHPDFGAPGTFGYGKAYHIVTQIPSEGTRRGLPESGIAADFSAVEKRAYGDTTANGLTGLSPEGSSFGHQTVVREYDLSAWITSGYAADSLTGASAPPSRDVLRVDQLGGNHSTFDMAFNARGDLSVTTGDSGFNQGPTHPDFAGRSARQSSQDLNTIYGKVFRINPDVTASHAGRVGENGQYSIPADNPYYDTTLDPRFVLAPGADPENDGDPDSTVANSTVIENNDGTLDEIYAVGLRSPIRVENDPRDATGSTLILGDVGGGSREEATLFDVATSGPNAGQAPNLGWGRFEGTINGSTSVTLAPGSVVVPPNFEYDHSEQSLTRSGGQITSFNNETGGLAIQGGEIYSGTQLGSAFTDKYIASELGFHNTNTVELSRLIVGDFDNPGTFTMLNLDPSGQRFDSPQLAADDFAPGFNFSQPGVDFFGDGTRLLPERLYGVYADSETGELFVLGGSTLGNATISRIIAVGTPGDVDGMNGVTIEDFNIIRDNLGKEVLSRDMGDLTGDGKVGLSDFQEWLDNAPPQVLAEAGFATVPEPSAAVLLLLAIAGLRGVFVRGE